MQVAMLGPLEVRADDSGSVLEVGGSRLRALLIMLALRPGQLVPASQPIDGLWADRAPAGAANALKALVSRLRRARPGAVIESRPAGYQLRLDPRSTDIVRFEEDFLASTGIFSGLGERWKLALALSGLAMLEGWRGEHAAAADHYRRATELAAEIGTAEDEIHLRLYLAREIWLLGEHDAAYAELAWAQREAERLKLPEVSALSAYTARDLSRLDGDAQAARAKLTRAAELAGPPNVALQIRGSADRTIVDKGRVASAARAELGQERFEAAYQRGQDATMDTLAAFVPHSHPALEP